MLGLVGLFGAVMASVAADALFNHVRTRDEDAEDGDIADHADSHGVDADSHEVDVEGDHGSLLDQIDAPHRASDDLPWTPNGADVTDQAPHDAGTNDTATHDTATHGTATHDTMTHDAHPHAPHDQAGAVADAVSTQPEMRSALTGKEALLARLRAIRDRAGDGGADGTGDGAYDGNHGSSDLPTPADDPVDRHGGTGSDILDGRGAADHLWGEDGDDALLGRDGNDSLYGGAGNDTLTGDAGDDSLDGGEGADSLDGGDGDDHLTGGAGNDRIDGEYGNDTLDGGEGDDSLTGGQGDDAIAAGTGNDTVDAGDGNDSVTGGAGSDDLSGGGGDDTLWGGEPGAGDDHATDYLNGGAGRDEMHVGAGDYANGGEGADTYVLEDHPADQQAAQITDWHPEEDSLVVVYDPAAHPDPTLDVVTEQGSPDATITLDGVPIAHVAGGAGLTVDAIRLQAAA
jgi:Ca2+-binding RTX toxin-like protein